MCVCGALSIHIASPAIVLSLVLQAAYPMAMPAATICATALLAPRAISPMAHPLELIVQCVPLAVSVLPNFVLANLPARFCSVLPSFAQFYACSSNETIETKAVLPSFASAEVYTNDSVLVLT